LSSSFFVRRNGELRLGLCLCLHFCYDRCLCLGSRLSNSHKSGIHPRVTHPTPITKHSLLLLLLLLLHTYRTHPTPIILIFYSYYTLIILLLLHAYRTHASFKCTRVNNPSKTIQPQN
jgi:hypothetical protein